MKITILVVTIMASFAFSQEVEKAPLNSARILASKLPLSQYAIENMEYVVEYFLVNVGDKPAAKVSLDDRKAFPTQDYELVKGLLQVHWDKLPAGENVTHSVVIKPRKYGIFNHTSAVVSYYPTEDAKEARISFSSSLGENTVYSQKSYNRQFGQRYTTWLIFLAFTIPTTLLPYYIWLGLKNKYPETNVQKQEAESKKKSK